MAADLEADVRAAYAAWDAAFNKGDAKAVAAAYLPNGKLLPPSHQVLSGPDDVELFFGGLIANDVKGHSLRLIACGGDGKLVYATAHWAAKGADDAVGELGGIATHVFERLADGTLKLALHTFN